MTADTFYFDLGSPFVYLAAERLAQTMPAPLHWQPVSLGGLFKLNGRSSWAVGDPVRREAGMAEVERRVHAYGLPPVRWPDPWPGHYLFAMRAATYAGRVGRGPEFALAALRHAFAGGHDLGDPRQVLTAAEKSGLDPKALERAIDDPDMKQALRDATEAAHGLGVFGVPTVAIAGELFWGDDRLADAAAAARPTRG